MPENEEKLFPDEEDLKNLSMEDSIALLLTMISMGKAERERKRREAERAAEENDN